MKTKRKRKKKKEEKEEPVVVKAGAQFGLERKKQEEAAAIQFQKCSVCGQMIPVNEMQEHVRIELLNPSWKREKEELWRNKDKRHSLQRYLLVLT